MRLDPRYSCSCVKQSVVDELYKCEPPEPEIAVCFGGIDIEETDKTCPRGYFYDMKTCRCLIKNNCNLFAPCPNGGSLDPTRFCECVSADKYKELT